MKRLLSFLLAFSLLSIGAVAFAQDQIADGGPSSWAKEEIERAIALDFVPTHLQSDYQAPMTRAEFAELSLCFLQLQFNLNPQGEKWFDIRGLGHMYLLYENARSKTWLRAVNEAGGQRAQSMEAYLNNNGNHKNDIFNDTRDSAVTLAYLLGIVNGRGNGTFGPNDAITRQEAACMLARTYARYANKPASVQGGTNFPDADTIANWAVEDVALMEHWNVMNGLGDGAFHPLEPYSREQCIVTFLRMYEQAEESRYFGTVEPLLSYEQMWQYTLDGGHATAPNFSQLYAMEGKTCSMALQIYMGTMASSTQRAVVIVYRSGGYRQIVFTNAAEHHEISQILSSAREEDGYIRFNEDETQIIFCGKDYSGEIRTLTFDTYTGEYQFI